MMLRFALDEIVGVKEAARGLPALLERVNADTLAIVLTRRGEPRAVLLSVERYERLLGTGRKQPDPEERGRTKQAEGDG